MANDCNFCRLIQITLCDETALHHGFIFDELLIGKGPLNSVGSILILVGHCSSPNGVYGCAVLQVVVIVGFDQIVIFIFQLYVPSRIEAFVLFCRGSSPNRYSIGGILLKFRLHPFLNSGADPQQNDQNKNTRSYRQCRKKSSEAILINGFKYFVPTL